MGNQQINCGDIGVSEADIVAPPETRAQVVDEYYRLTIQVATPEAKLDAVKVQERGLAKFANPKFPKCWTCVVAAERGGPRHEASSMCRSGKHSHCSCDFCF